METRINISGARQNDDFQPGEMESLVAIGVQFIILDAKIPAQAIGAALFPERVGPDEQRIMMRSEEIHEPAIFDAPRNNPAATEIFEFAKRNPAVESHDKI